VEAESAVVDEKMFFAIDSGQVWITDGTLAGTVLVKDIDGDRIGTNPRHLTAAGSDIYFFAGDGVTGEKLWQSDGTEDGTRIVKDFEEDAGGFLNDLLAVGPRIFFSAYTESANIWTSDGTDAGTYIVSDLNPDTPLVVAGGKVFAHMFDGG